MVFKINKDFKNRKKYTNVFLKKNIYLSFLRDSSLSLEERQYLYFKLNKVKNNNISQTQFKNYCLLTKNSRSTFKILKMSRHQFKNMTLNGLIPGWSLSSW